MARRKSPNSREKKYHDAVMHHGCAVTSESYSVELHHFIGRSAYSEYTQIGHFAAYPIAYDLHNIRSDNPLNVTKCKNSFIERYGNEKDIWYENLKKTNTIDLIPMKIIRLIMEY